MKKSGKESKEEWYRRLVETEYSTSGHKKFVRYLDTVLNTYEYQELIENTRSKHEIPETGFSPEKEGGRILEKQGKEYGLKFYASVNDFFQDTGFITEDQWRAIAN